jgi:hypothetical protein
MILIQEKYLAENFPSKLLVLGGVGLAVHYKQLSKLFSGVPLIMASGKPLKDQKKQVQTQHN